MKGGDHSLRFQKLTPLVFKPFQTSYYVKITFFRFLVNRDQKIKSQGNIGFQQEGKGGDQSLRFQKLNPLVFKPFQTSFSKNGTFPEISGVHRLAIKGGKGTTP